MRSLATVRTGGTEPSSRGAYPPDERERDSPEVLPQPVQPEADDGDICLHIFTVQLEMNPTEFIPLLDFSFNSKISRAVNKFCEI